MLLRVDAALAARHLPPVQLRSPLCCLVGGNYTPPMQLCRQMSWTPLVHPSLGAALLAPCGTSHCGQDLASAAGHRQALGFSAWPAKC